jgi:hypothetical protein
MQNAKWGQSIVTISDVKTESITRLRLVGGGSSMAGRHKARRADNENRNKVGQSQQIGPLETSKTTRQPVDEGRTKKAATYGGLAGREWSRPARGETRTPRAAAIARQSIIHHGALQSPGSRLPGSRTQRGSRRELVGPSGAQRSKNDLEPWA